MIIHENGPSDYRPSFEKISEIRSESKIEFNLRTLENKLQENEIDEYIKNEEIEDRLDKLSNLIHEEEHHE